MRTFNKLILVTLLFTACSNIKGVQDYPVTVKDSTVYEYYVQVWDSTIQQWADENDVDPDNIIMDLRGEEDFYNLKDSTGLTFYDKVLKTRQDEQN